MPFYKKLSPKNKEGKRTLQRLLELREQINTEIPRRTLDKTLLVATWNIRDFDKATFGLRLDESIYYIAEIIAAFDVVAIQEVNKDLTGLDRVMEILGGHWKRLFTDETVGSRGNDERMVFVYDSRKVSFQGLASELVLPPIDDGSGVEQPTTQLSRTPFMVGFKAGWSSFILTTVHIIWGEDVAESKRRVEEISSLAKFLKERTEDPTTWSRNIIMLGDFNIFGVEDATFKAITDQGFHVPEKLLEFRSNAKKTRHYDQIAFMERPGHVELTGNAGVFDFYQSVFKDTEQDKKTYMKHMPEFETKADGEPRSEQSKKNYYQTYWRTHQMSDHLPMWMELKIDFSDEYLTNKLQ